VDATCPCGAGAFGACCAPVLAGALAETPERLMRSRYTAFALGDVRHLRDTWHPGTRPDDPMLDADTEWTGLEVIAHNADGDRGMVTFRAHWRERGTGTRGVLEERSRFARRAGAWYYVDAV
jgi:SEC-C motif domain protein